MANWLSRATDAFRKPPPAAPQPYIVRCDCGGQVTGERVGAAQKPACPDCGNPVFVLPVNVYPAPVKPVRQDSPRTAPKSTSPGRDNTAAPKVPSLPDRRNGRPEPQPPAIAPEGILLESRTRILTPVRLIAAAISLVAILTVWGLWRRHQFDSAKAIIPAAHEAGMKALKDGNFSIAARELTRARDAVDLLRRDDAEANTIRRYCREAIAGNDLSDSGLFAILANYVSDSPQSKSRAAQLETRSRGKWLLLDAVIVNPDAKDRPPALDMPLLIDGTRFRIEVDSAIIRNAARREEAGRLARVIFAAQMVEIRPAAKDDPETVLVLNGKSAFLWSNLETYAALGYVEERAEEVDLTRELLARQLEQMEGTK